MAVVGAKKTVNLHKYSLKVSKIISNWKFILPVIFSLAGLISGSISAKGEGELYRYILQYCQTFAVSTQSNILAEFIKYLIPPTIFAAISFFLGLCMFGGLIVNIVPMAFGYLISSISYYMYFTYTLKGLAYCVIIIFPYTLLAIFSIILCSRESILMSEYIIINMSKSSKFVDYSFSTYYKNYLKHYVIIIISALVKVTIDNLFISLFTF